MSRTGLAVHTSVTSVKCGADVEWLAGNSNVHYIHLVSTSVSSMKYVSAVFIFESGEYFKSRQYYILDHTCITKTHYIYIYPLFQSYSDYVSE